MEHVKAIGELPVLSELESPKWGGDFPWLTDDLFEREYQGPLASPWGDLVVYSNDDVSALIKNRSVTHQTLEASIAGFCPAGAPKDKGLANFMTFNSFAFRAPEHRPFKQLTADRVSPAALVDVRGAVHDITVDALTSASRLTDFDVVSQIAKPVVGKVWSHMVGVNDEESARLLELGEELGELLSLQLAEEQIPGANAAYDEYMEVLTGGIVRSHRTGDFPMLNALAEAHAAMGPVGRPEEPFRPLASMLADGFATLPVLLSSVMWAVAAYEVARPDKGDVDQWAASVFSEASRLHPAVVGTLRQASEDFDYNGVHVPADTNVFMLWMFANRDPKAFPDPMEFQLERAGRRKQVTFGGTGAYTCTGQNITRLVCEEMLKAIALNDASIHLEEQAQWTSGSLLHRFPSQGMSISLP